MTSPAVATPVHAARRYFPAQGSTLLVNGRTLHEVAREVGSSPFYVMDRGA